MFENTESSLHGQMLQLRQFCVCNEKMHRSFFNLRKIQSEKRTRTTVDRRMKLECMRVPWLSKLGSFWTTLLSVERKHRLQIPKKIDLLNLNASNIGVEVSTCEIFKTKCANTVCKWIFAVIDQELEWELCHRIVMCIHIAEIYSYIRCIQKL